MLREYVRVVVQDSRKREEIVPARLGYFRRLTAKLELGNAFGSMSCLNEAIRRHTRRLYGGCYR